MTDLKLVDVTGEFKRLEPLSLENRAEAREDANEPIRLTRVICIACLLFWAFVCGCFWAALWHWVFR